MIARPTRTYTSLDAAYDRFNRDLFGGQLPPCLITMQRHKGAYGYFSGERFASLDQPGGKDTGQSVTHIIEEGGRFDQACTAYLATAPAILYHDRAGDGEAAAVRKKKAASKTKYTCPGCQQNAWAKPDARLVCGDCNEAMEAEEGEGDG
jgi:hypothetical protein